MYKNVYIKKTGLRKKKSVWLSHPIKTFRSFWNLRKGTCQSDHNLKCLSDTDPSVAFSQIVESFLWLLLNSPQNYWVSSTALEKSYSVISRNNVAWETIVSNKHQKIRVHETFNVQEQNLGIWISGIWLLENEEKIWTWLKRWHFSNQ